MCTYYYTFILHPELTPGLISDRFCPFSVVFVERCSVWVVTVMSNSNDTVVGLQ